MSGNRFYRRLLRAFPPRFRERFETDMTGLFDDRRRDAELDGIGRRLMATYPKTNTASVVVAPLQEELAGNSRPLALLFGLDGLTAPPLAGVAAIGLLVALLATWLPARDATRVSPVETRRGE